MDEILKGGMPIGGEAMKIIISLIIIGSAVGGYWYWRTWSNQQEELSKQQMIKELGQKESSLIGWIQDINKSERSLVVRRKNLMPFMPKRETVFVKDETILQQQEKRVTLDHLKLGQLVKVIYTAGANINKSTYVAKSISVEIEKK